MEKANPISKDLTNLLYLTLETIATTQWESRNTTLAIKTRSIMFLRQLSNKESLKQLFNLQGFKFSQMCNVPVLLQTKRGRLHLPSWIRERIKQWLLTYHKYSTRGYHKFMIVTAMNHDGTAKNRQMG